MPEWLLTLLNHPWLPWSGALIIAVWAILAWRSMVNGQINPAHQQLHEQLTVHNQDPAVALQLFAPPAGSDSTTPPQLSLESLLGKKWERYHLQDMPNRLLALGLLFTLLGLCAALFSLSRELQAASLTTAKESLQTVLQVTLWKFLTSLSGLCAATLYTRAARWHKEQLLLQIHNLRDRLREQVAYRAERAQHLPHLSPAPAIPVAVADSASLPAEPVSITLPPPDASVAPSSTQSFTQPAAPSTQQITEEPFAPAIPSRTAPLAPEKNTELRTESLQPPLQKTTKKSTPPLPLSATAPTPANPLPLAQLAGAFHEQQQRRARSLVKTVR
ncbi:hypothetical protein [Candidatus Magnetaquicoccus inordinatus]|uniref:hypothetical protein n=1 Tax=Candidatus Magnetaquicoccus inordinatus TaxID=2496818 RepID=UPI00102BD917|nr:hypothetical protein [Candidatus Magnetaquicoccus inordinatus]